MGMNQICHAIPSKGIEGDLSKNCPGSVGQTNAVRPVVVNKKGSAEQGAKLLRGAIETILPLTVLPV